MWGGLFSRQPPSGRLFFFNTTSLLEAGCRLIARPTLSSVQVRAVPHETLTVGFLWGIIMKTHEACRFFCSPARCSRKTHTTWSDYSGSSDSAQYSALEQINRSNVAKLEVAWTYPTGDSNKYFFNPLVVDNVVYVLAKNNSIVALDAVTGKEIWTHPSGPEIRIITNRGMNYWESKDRKERRLLFASNHFLRAIDARTGQTIESFGTNGAVQFKGRTGPRSEDFVVGAIHNSRPRFRGSADFGIRHQSGLRLRARRSARLRRPDRPRGLDVSHHPSSG